MTTGWGTDCWQAPRAAWALARDTAAEQGPAAAKDIPVPARPDVIVALGAQVRSFLEQAALQEITWVPDTGEWAHDVPCDRVRRLAADSLSGKTVRVPGKLCSACTLAALALMARALLDAMTAAGIPPDRLVPLLDWLAARAR
jgi:hypothetical protein